ncbi:MAG: hypothetical protein M1335_01330 [Chloroflexi bacterium]|nr:hypothetical protein [Chloroflexota bacterium]
MIALAAILIILPFVTAFGILVAVISLGLIGAYGLFERFSKRPPVVPEVTEGEFLSTVY